MDLLAHTQRHGNIYSTMSKPSVLLFGLGGIGGIYATILQLSGKCDVHVVARSNYHKVRNQGFKIVSPKFGNHNGMRFAGGKLLGLFDLTTEG